MLKDIIEGVQLRYEYMKVRMEARRVVRRMLANDQVPYSNLNTSLIPQKYVPLDPTRGMTKTEKVIHSQRYS
jgi:hypothetical protein